MPVEKPMKFEDGKVWFVGTMTLGFFFDIHTAAQVVIPIEQLDNLADEEIGKRVRRLVLEAEMVSLEEQTTLWRHTIYPFEVKDACEFLQKLEPYKNRSEIIRNAIIKINIDLEEIRRAEEKKLTNRMPSLSLRNQILQRDNYICRYCGQSVKDDSHIDHVIPYSLGGLTEMSNLVTSCPKCNMSKAGKLLEECNMSLIEI